jgi:hypothetical protein
MKRDLVTDLRMFCRLIAGRLLHVDGPYKNKRGRICYRVWGREFERWFYSWDRAEAFKERHNARVNAAARKKMEELP